MVSPMRRAQIHWSMGIHTATRKQVGIMMTTSASNGTRQTSAKNMMNMKTSMPMMSGDPSSCSPNCPMRDERVSKMVV